jgi:hypothetical protein
MAAITHVFTIRRVALMLGRDEDLLWDDTVEKLRLRASLRPDSLLLGDGRFGR